MEERWPTSGYLIEKTFACMCREHLAEHTRPLAGFPDGPMQYRGLQREPLQAWTELFRGSGVVEPTDQELQACLFLKELEDAGKAGQDIIFALDDARETVRKIQAPVEREIVWARRLDIDDRSDQPAGTVLLGYEPNEFYPPTCYSPIANCLFFTVYPELEPPPEERERFMAHYDKLNTWGLFNTRADAEEYLSSFHSLFPDQRDYAYYMTEVRAVAD